MSETERGRLTRFAGEKIFERTFYKNHLECFWPCYMLREHNISIARTSARETGKSVKSFFACFISVVMKHKLPEFESRSILTIKSDVYACQLSVVHDNIGQKFTSRSCH